MSTVFSPEDYQELSVASAAYMRGDWTTVSAALSRFVEKHPWQEGVLPQLIEVLQKGDEFAEAYRLAATLCAVHHHVPQFHNIAACAAGALGDAKLALRHCDEGLRIAPHSSMLRWNRALFLIALGQWEEGWAEYEERWCNRAPLRTRIPRWDGERLGPDKVLYLWAEQGLGDTLMMLRFLAKAREKAGSPRLVVEIAKEALSLYGTTLTTLAPAVEFVTPAVDGSFSRPFDAHCPLMSLPHVLGVKGPDDIPSGHQFNAEPDEKVKEFANGRKVLGICWKGSPGHAGDRLRSMPPAVVKAFVKCLPDDVALVSLVPGECIPGVDKEKCFVFHPAHFGHTAKVLISLDTLVTVDTMVAHLAGCLNVRTCLLLPKAADYRWMLGKSETFPLADTYSTWYDETILFRQTKPHDWFTPFYGVLHELGRGYTNLFCDPEPLQSLVESSDAGKPLWGIDDDTKPLTTADRRSLVPNEEFDKAAASIPCPVGGINLSRWLYHTARMLNAKTVVEVGTCCGAVTIWLAKAVKDGWGDEGRLHTCDTNELVKDGQKAAITALERLGLRKNVHMFDGTSFKLFEELETFGGAEYSGEWLDFAFLDGDHAGKTVLAEIQALWDKLKPGGIIAGHDPMNALTPGVQMAFKKFAHKFPRHRWDKPSMVMFPMDGSVIAMQKPYGVGMIYQTDNAAYLPEPIYLSDFDMDQLPVLNALRATDKTQQEECDLLTEYRKAKVNEISEASGFPSSSAEDSEVRGSEQQSGGSDSCQCYKEGESCGESDEQEPKEGEVVYPDAVSFGANKSATRIDFLVKSAADTDRMKD